MFPLLTILILLLLGPANAERLAVEGRLPAALAAHLARVAPVRATVAAPVEEPERTATLQSGGPVAFRTTARRPLRRVAVQGVLLPACPARAGPSVA